jgi:hypothetical protein
MQNHLLAFRFEVHDSGYFFNYFSKLIIENTFSIYGVNFKFTTVHKAKSIIGGAAFLKPRQVLGYYS